MLLHGGYRSDFLALDPDGFRVQVRAPTSTTAPGGAALVIRGAGARPTLLEWIEARGLDADAVEEATFGVYALDPGGALTLRDMRIQAGVPGFESYAWGGMIGPANMPRDIVMRLNKEIVDTLRQKDVIDRMLSEGTVPTPSSPEEFVAYMKSELKKWGDVVKLANIKAE